MEEQKKIIEQYKYNTDWKLKNLQKKSAEDDQEKSYKEKAWDSIRDKLEKNIFMLNTILIKNTTYGDDEEKKQLGNRYDHCQNQVKENMKFLCLVVNTLTKNFFAEYKEQYDKLLNMIRNTAYRELLKKINEEKKAGFGLDKAQETDFILKKEYEKENGEQSKGDIIQKFTEASMSSLLSRPRKLPRKEEIVGFFNKHLNKNLSATQNVGRLYAFLKTKGFRCTDIVFHKYDDSQKARINIQFIKKFQKYFPKVSKYFEKKWKIKNFDFSSIQL